jgi:DNA-binding NtrC family response regulator
MGSQRRLSSVPRRVPSGNEPDISRPRDLAFNRDLTKLRDIALLVLTGLKSFEQAADQGHTKLNFKEQVSEFERSLIRRALIRAGGNQRRAALALGVKISTLNAKIKRYGIEVTSLREALQVEDCPNR